MDFIKMAIVASLVVMSLNANTGENISLQTAQEKPLSLWQRLNILATYLSPRCRELDDHLASLNSKKERWEALYPLMMLAAWHPDLLKEIISKECLYRLGKKYGLSRWNESGRYPGDDQ
jgi:hypothetical protein